MGDQMLTSSEMLSETLQYFISWLREIQISVQLLTNPSNELKKLLQVFLITNTPCILVFSQNFFF